MALTLTDRVNTKPGIETVGVAHGALMVSPDEGFLGYQPGEFWSWMFERYPLLNLGGPFPYVAGEGTETKDNSSTILRGAKGVEFKLQATPSDDDDVAFTGLANNILVQDKVLVFGMRVRVSSAANLGLRAGLVTSSATEIFTAAPADGLYFVKAKNAATVLGRVVDNSGTPADTGTLATMTDDTDVLLGFACKPGSSAALSWGHWYMNQTKTAFTSAQLTALRAMLATTAATLAGHVGFRVNGTTQRTGTVNFAVAGIDR